MRLKILDTAVRLMFMLLLAGSVACSGGSGGSADPTPVAYTYAAPAVEADTWVTSHAADEGLDVALIESMMNAIHNGRYPVIDSIAMVRSGRLVLDETIRTATDAEDQRVGNTNPRMHTQFSTIKSITAIAVGIAIERGYLPGVDAPYLDFFPYAAYDNWDARKNDITLGHVLAMRAGLAWDEWDPPYTSPDNQLIRFYDEEHDYSKALLDLPLADDPGTSFAYNTAASISLAQAIENMAPLTFVDFGLSELIVPLGITEVEFLTTPTGLPNAGGGFYFRTRDMAKFGQLVLNGGTWNGARIVGASWISDMLEIRTPVSWAEPDARDWKLDGYGYQWWLGHYVVDSAALDAWVMWGFGGQWVVVVPERELVIAINSHGYDDSDGALQQAHELINDFLLPAASR
jgi:CubicO group peptidase (beta-lactamase class C family)